MAGPLNFSGPCKDDVTIQIDGTLLGTNDLPKYNGGSWINIFKVNNVAIAGSGTIDGQGANVYSKDPAEAKAFPNVREMNPYTRIVMYGVVLDRSAGVGHIHITVLAWTDFCTVSAYMWCN